MDEQNFVAIPRRFRPFNEAAEGWRSAYTAVLAEREGMRGVLIETRRLVSEASNSGFTDEDAVRALYVNNGAISAAISPAPKEPEQ